MMYLPDASATHAEGVRNYRARNILRAMRVGQKAFFYQSACKFPGVVGVVEIVREAYPDDTQFDGASKYFDEKASPKNPRWSMVDIKFVRSPVRHPDGDAASVVSSIPSTAVILTALPRHV
jgi:predicted RNA-binding protein with PUA-like domain